jgi:hypothetical protein
MSAFEADRFNRSRTSPKAAISNQLSAKTIARMPKVALISKVPLVTGTNSIEPSAQSQFLSAAPKKLLQNFRRTARQHPASHLNAMVQSRMVQHSHDRVHGPRFGVVRAKNQSPDARMHHGASAHRARLNCSKQVARP